MIRRAVLGAILGLLLVGTPSRASTPADSFQIKERITELERQNSYAELIREQISKRNIFIVPETTGGVDWLKVIPREHLELYMTSAVTRPLRYMPGVPAGYEEIEEFIRDELQYYVRYSDAVFGLLGQSIAEREGELALLREQLASLRVGHLGGHWDVLFEKSDGTLHDGGFHLIQTGDRLSGTGTWYPPPAPRASRFVEGYVRGTSVRLEGSSPELLETFHGVVQADGSIHGEFIYERCGGRVRRDREGCSDPRRVKGSWTATRP